MTTTRTHFTFRVDTWTPEGESIVEHVAGVEHYQVALATFLAACQRWPGTPITLRQGARVIEDSACAWCRRVGCPRNAPTLLGRVLINAQIAAGLRAYFAVTLQRRIFALTLTVCPKTHHSIIAYAYNSCLNSKRTGIGGRAPVNLMTTVDAINLFPQPSKI